ncbi:SUKH-4 family immunity protein [Streptomyces sp. MST-110588]|uniref:SUKH-4 family immunity protein n=1 Tax=Streptomyces sp. MST-110588 TaxID=2833628 RepID=UPI001F5C1E16|nr:SUKH-4 family immunity protein [Streptomyces sp. MST-110588]UNO38735.1 SUKH-4 family immunity protein [Streptomyces sp. MST-110588]
MAGYSGDSQQKSYGSGDAYGAGSSNGGARPWCRLDAASLPNALTHEPSWRFLVEVGLPAKAAGLEFTGLREGRLKTFRKERDKESDEGSGSTAVEDGRLLVLGEHYHGHGSLVLDGATGGAHLVAWERHELRHGLLASGLPDLAGLAPPPSTPGGSSPRIRTPGVSSDGRRRHRSCVWPQDRR